MGILVCLRQYCLNIRVVGDISDFSICFAHCSVHRAYTCGILVISVCMVSVWH